MKWVWTVLVGVLVAGVAALVLLRRRGLSGLLRSGFRLWRGLRMFALLKNKFLRV